MYDYETSIFVRKIDVTPTNIIWNDNRKSLALISEEVAYILKVNTQELTNYISAIENDENNNNNNNEEGCETGFEPIFEINETILTGFFLDDVFVYLNNKNKINYAIEDKIFNISTLDSNFFLLGYYQPVNKIYLMDKTFRLISYTLPISFVNYQIAILKKDFERAAKVKLSK